MKIINLIINYLKKLINLTLQFFKDVSLALTPLITQLKEIVVYLWLTRKPVFIVVGLVILLILFWGFNAVGLDWWWGRPRVEQPPLPESTPTVLPSEPAIKGPSEKKPEVNELNTIDYIRKQGEDWWGKLSDKDKDSVILVGTVVVSVTVVVVCLCFNITPFIY